MSNKATVTNLRATIIPKSDQLNADQLLGGTMTIRVAEVSVSESPDQPVIIHYENENGRPYKPCKSMRKVLIFAWGDDGTKWVGRRIMLFNDPEVKWAGVKVGGIRIKRLSDIDGDIQVGLTSTRGKKDPYIIKQLPHDPIVSANPAAPSITDADLQAARDQLATAAPFGMQTLQKAWGSLSAEIRAALGGACPQEYKDIANAPPPVMEAEPQASDDDEGMF